MGQSWLTPRFPCCPVLEKIRSAVGSTQLLLSQKVQQFFRLCQQSMVSALGSGTCDPGCVSPHSHETESWCPRGRVPDALSQPT